MEPYRAGTVRDDDRPRSGATDPRGIAFADGAYRPVAEAGISLLDFGFTRSDVTYDVVHVWKGAFFRLEDHLDRFLASLAKARLAPPYTRSDMRRILIECVRRSGLEDAYVAMLSTRGVPPPGTRDPRGFRNTFYAYAIPFVWIATPEQRRRGLRLMVGSRPRTAARSVDPTVKNYSWRDMSQSLLEAFDKDGETVVMLDAEGNVNEGPGFNVFIVLDGRVMTPASGVLEGITRKSVLELCAENGIPARCGTIGPEALRRAGEIFIASTAGGIVAVTRLDGREVGDGVPGPLTRRLSELYWASHEDDRHATRVDYD